MKNLVLVLLAVLGLGIAIASLRAEEKPVQEPQPQIEVVFVLDTTGSMGGLIKGAKQKIWSIANTLATGKPTPEIKMGLVGYRDRGDAYITKITPLTTDLDAVYSDLMKFQAQGGGDGPESVNQALHEAVNKIKWSEGAKTFRVIYLVGDYPPHMDYKQDVKYPTTCKQAARRGIIINTIQCGNYGKTTAIWKDIANRAEGAFFQVAQAGGAVTVSTPYDGKMAKMSSKLEGTRLYYGTAAKRKQLAEREEVADEIRKKAAPGASADRAAFLATEAGGKAFAGRSELISDYAAGKIKLDKINKEHLPEKLRKMPQEELQSYLKAQVKKRKQLRAEITKLQAKRQTYIKKELSEKGEEDSFDAAIRNSARKQAKEKGIAIEE
ncbi:MAG: VWA domain-containing protein [Candidatus Brocadiia bacterium]